MNVLDSFDLSGKVAVVTGGNRGLGEAWVQSLVDVGAAVVIAARDADRSRETAHTIGESVDTVHLDVRDADDVRRALATIVERHGRVDILVNNAGTCIHRPALEVSDDEWEQVIDVNLNGLWRCSQSFGRHMIENGGGVIVNIGSISAQIVNRPQMQPAYNASKAAVHQLTKSLAAEWAPHGVRVNALAPGYTKTEMAPVDRPRVPRSVDRRRADAALRHARGVRAGTGGPRQRRLQLHDGGDARHRRWLHRFLRYRDEGFTCKRALRSRATRDAADHAEARWSARSPAVTSRSRDGLLGVYARQE